jgi:hypothetical protein
VNKDGPIWGHIAFWAMGVILAGIVLIGSGLNGGGLSTQVRAVGNNIEVRWDNGAVQVFHDLINTDDGHITSVRVWGGNACWITVNNRMADGRDGSAPVICTWSREQT